MVYVADCADVDVRLLPLEFSSGGAYGEGATERVRGRGGEGEG